MTEDPWPLKTLGVGLFHRMVFPILVCDLDNSFSFPFTVSRSPPILETRFLSRWHSSVDAKGDRRSFPPMFARVLSASCYLFFFFILPFVRSPTCVKDFSSDVFPQTPLPPYCQPPAVPSDLLPLEAPLNPWDLFSASATSPLLRLT